MTITEYITNELRARIQSRTGLPEQLTLQNISAMYKVSLTPVRLAVDALIREKYLEKQDNGRLVINEKKIPAGKSKTPTLITPPPDWLKIISRDIVRMSLRGESTRLGIAETAEKYGAGRNIVHDVFKRLGDQGMLDHQARCGWSVRPFSESDLDAYLDIRELLELHAFQLARPRLNPDDLRQMLARNITANSDSPAHLDNSLHLYWIQRSQNRYILDFYERHAAYYSFLYQYAAVGDALTSQLAAQHRAILQAALAERWKEASEALSNDIRSLRSILRSAIGMHA